jgi:hypothetical protein
VPRKASRILLTSEKLQRPKNELINGGILPRPAGDFQLTSIFTIAYDSAYEEAEAYVEKKGRAGIDFQAQDK